MPSKKIYDLSECSEFRQTLAARPRMAVRVTALILLLMVLAAFLMAVGILCHLIGSTSSFSASAFARLTATTTAASHTSALPTDRPS